MLKNTSVVRPFVTTFLLAIPYWNDYMTKQKLMSWVLQKKLQVSLVFSQVLMSLSSFDKTNN